MKSVNEEEWFNWKWQLLNSISDLNLLAADFPRLKEDLENLKWVVIKYRVRVTPYYLSLANRDDPDDPIARQFLPSASELVKNGDPDPYDEEGHMPVPGIIHRYRDRALLLMTNICPVYCRHCMRKRTWRRKGYVLRGGVLQSAIDYIRKHEEIRDVLITGGDPLLMKDEEIEEILERLRSIPHVRIVRIGSRVPVTLPMRLTPSLGEIFRRYGPIYINTHFNHPAEITDYATEKIREFAGYGVIWGNQTVLLRGVNDSVDTLASLFYRLAEIGVRPYYLFQCDPVEGVDHFRIPLETALDIYKELLDLSGMVVPKFAIDLPDGGGKVILAPDPQMEKVEGGYMITSREGRRIFYPDPAGTEG